MDMANPSQLPVAGEAKDPEENPRLLLHLRQTCVLKPYPYTHRWVQFPLSF